MARIAEGDTLPNVSVQIWDDSKGGPKTVTTEELFANKKVHLPLQFAHRIIKTS